MKKYRTHYDNLKVSRTATNEEIKLSYRRLMQKYHPDKNPTNDAERISKIISIAYKVLSDPISRKEHDNWIDSKNSAYEEEVNDSYEEEVNDSYEEEVNDSYEEWKKYKEQREYEEWKKQKEYQSSENNNYIYDSFLSNPDSSFYVGKQIPEKKLNNFIRNTHNKFHEHLDYKNVYFYYDETVFGSGDEGVVITDQYLISINSIGENSTIIVPLKFIENATIKGFFNKTVTINTTTNFNIKRIEITLTQGNKGAEELTRAINFMVKNNRK